jgi:hypothetical protein
MNELTPTKRKAAWIIAIAVDAIQFPIEATGLLGWVMGTGLDVVTMLVLWRLIGWHWVFLPSFLTEWVPYLNYAPTWTIAIAIALRNSHGEDPTDPPIKDVTPPTIQPPELK